MNAYAACYNFAFCISGLCELHCTTVYTCLVQYLYRLKHALLVSEDNLFIPAQNITGSVVEALLPVLKEMKADIKNLNELYSNLSETVTKLEETVSNLNTTVEDHKSQTSSELAALHSSIDNPPINVIGNAVLVKLLPYLNNIEDTLCEKIDESANSLSEDFHDDISDLNERLTDLEVKVCNLSDSVINLDETMAETIEEYKNQTTYELTELHTSLQTSIDNHSTHAVNAVLGKLQPYLNNLDEKIDESTNSLSEDLSSLSGSITDLTEKVCNVSDSQIEIAQDMNETINTHMEHLNMKLMSVEASMRQQHRDIGDELEQHNNHVTSNSLLHTTYSKLDSLDTKQDELNMKLMSVEASMRQEHRDIGDELEQHNNHVNSELIELEIDHNTTYSKLDSLDTKQDELNMKVMSVSSELEQTILSNVTEELKKTQDFLDAYLCGYTCGGEGGWRRVVYLDMTDPNTYCPSGWQLITIPKRTCGKVSTGRLSCESVFFPVTGGDYNRVCGSIRAYQYRRTDGFEAYDEGQATTIDEAYVAGVSLTHGSPRQHIWTFAAGAKEEDPSINDACPCDATAINISIPPFVGEDYFCESGMNSSYRQSFAEADPLWDGKGCVSTSTCCSLNNPPYFTNQLTNPTTDDIEARICQYGSSDDSPVEYIELYVKGPSDSECDSKIDSINSKLNEVAAILSKEHRDIGDELNMKVMSVSSELEQNVIREVKKTYDLLNTSLGHTVCGGEGGWRRVVYLDMTDLNTNCPSGWRLVLHPKRTCGQVSTSSTLSCDSVFFPVTGGEYNKVCGRIRAYQDGGADAFKVYGDGVAGTIDRPYVSGVSLTHGSPRQHIWTFAVGATEDRPTRDDSCPCDATISISIPPFVGGDYFCESGINFGSIGAFHPDDPLWDGKGCASNSTCCEFNNPPYFTKQLSNPTTDDIEARICQWGYGDDCLIEFVEIYVE